MTRKPPAPRVRPDLYADQAAEAIRDLNHATLPRDGYWWPSDIDAVIGALETMTARLPQALDQAVTWLEAAHAAGHIGHDQLARADDVTEQVHGLLGDLERAAREAHHLTLTLASARSTSAHLTGSLPEQDI